ncbi:hypothetical protein [Laspinema olomoucense]|uniref:Uncharacterized protein n=1 Tax=Laspinema olomoucense D3b TaxID=2953688 RepID=A0ABT2NB38_9CYAN|nr:MULTISPECIES: hypothetical protein [unclassified Laspinema]MCT7974215.1 hypothetical protein [Laspinema sp. D3d]MCT7979914.1 hypothetical protein [Laspinema sp. D3b]
MAIVNKANLGSSSKERTLKPSKWAAIAPTAPLFPQALNPRANHQTS